MPVDATQHNILSVNLHNAFLTGISVALNNTDKVKLEDALRNIALKKQKYSDLPKAGKAV
jgi:hypothetical protein